MKNNNWVNPKKIGWVLKNFGCLGFGLGVGCHTQHPTQYPKKMGSNVYNLYESEKN